MSRERVTMHGIQLGSNRTKKSETRLAAVGERTAGFTLLELLIALSILLIVAGLTMKLLNVTLDSDRIRNGSRELQSYLAGARDRAIYAGQPRGVRLIPDPIDPSTVRSFVYIGAPADYQQGTIQVIAGTAWTAGAPVTAGAYFAPTGAPGNNPPFVFLAQTTGVTGGTEPIWPTAIGGTVADNTVTWQCFGVRNRLIDTTFVGPAWQQMMARGLLTNGATIVIGGTAYTMSQISSQWNLTRDFPGPFATALGYDLKLAPSILAGDEPRSLPQGIVVDLNNSVLPPSWGSPGAYTPQLDVLFSPGGMVMGPVASAGRIHFVLSEFVDASVPVPATSAVTGVPLLDATAAWQASTNYAAEQWVVPNPQNGLVFRCTTAGMSGAAQPAQFATAIPGQSVTDNGATWQCYLPKRRLVVSLATDTGRVTTSPISPTDKFRYAEIGEVTQ